MPLRTTVHSICPFRPHALQHQRSPSNPPPDGLPHWIPWISCSNVCHGVRDIGFGDMGSGSAIGPALSKYACRKAALTFRKTSSNGPARLKRERIRPAACRLDDGIHHRSPAHGRPCLRGDGSGVVTHVRRPARPLRRRASTAWRHVAGVPGPGVALQSVSIDRYRRLIHTSPAGQPKQVRAPM